LFAAGHLFAGSPLVSVSASPFPITNENEEATYTLTLSAPSSRNVGVAFVMSGTAIQGFDYVLIGNFNRSGQVLIPAGQTSATVTLHTLPDDGFPAREIATFNVINAARYHIGSPSHANVIILPRS
jgi:hypothetical protein